METQTVEYKQIWRDDFLKEICGFANAQGGTLYIGIADNGEVAGVENLRNSLQVPGSKSGSSMTTTNSFIRTKCMAVSFSRWKRRWIF